MRKIGPRLNKRFHSEQLVLFTNIIYSKVRLPQQTFAQFWENELDLFLHEIVGLFLRFRACGVAALVLEIRAIGCPLIGAIGCLLSLSLQSSFVNSRKNDLLDNLSLVVRQ